MNRASSLLNVLVNEDTTTGDVAPVMVGAPMITGPGSQLRRRKKRRPMTEDGPNSGNGADGTEGEDGEDGAKGVIPADAEELATEAHPNGQSTPQPAVPSVPNEALIPTAVALVAPDCTPDSDKPLDQSQVPAPVQPPASAPVQQPAAGSAAAEPTPAAATDGGVLRTLMGLHQSTYRPPTVASPQNPKTESQPAAAPTGSQSPEEMAQQILAEQKAAIFKSKIMEAAAGGGAMPAPHFNPNAGAKAAAAMRIVLGQ